MSSSASCLRCVYVAQQPCYTPPASILTYPRFQYSPLHAFSLRARVLSRDQFSPSSFVPHSNKALHLPARPMRLSRTILTLSTSPAHITIISIFEANLTGLASVGVGINTSLSRSSCALLRIAGCGDVRSVRLLLILTARGSEVPAGRRAVVLAIEGAFCGEVGREIESCIGAWTSWTLALSGPGSSASVAGCIVDFTPLGLL